MKRRPVGPFFMNGASVHAKNLAFWLPLMDNYPQGRISHNFPTIQGSPAIDYDNSRASWKFSGTSQYQTFAFAPVAVVPITISFWAKLNSTGSTRSALSLCASANTTNFFNVGLLSTGPNFRCQSGDGTTSSASSTLTVTTGIWYHVCAVYAASNSRACYTDGANKGTQSSTRNPTGINQTNIAALGGSGFTVNFNGWLSDIRIYNKAFSDADVAELADPTMRWDLFEQYYKIWAVPSTGASISLAGSIGPSGALLKQPNKLMGGGITPAGALLKRPGKLLAGALTPSGVLLTKPFKIFAGSITPTGALTKQPGKIISGSVTPSGTVKKQPNKLFAGAIGPVGSLLKSISTRVMGGTVSFVGGLIKQPKKLFSGSIGPTGSLLKQLAKLLSGAIGPTGALLKQPRKLLSGVLSFAGDMTVFRVIFIAVGGALSFIGTLSKQPNKLFGGSVQPVGALLKQPFKLLAGSISPSGALSTIRTKLLQLAGSLSFSGTLTKTPKKLYVGTVSFVGSLLKQPAKHFSGTLTTSGTVSMLKVVFLFLAGSLSFAGDVTKTVYKNFSGSISFTGILQRVHIVVSTGEVKFREMWKNMFRKMR